MPFVTAPALIEQSDFSQGWSPDGSNAHQGPGALNDVSNLLLEEATLALVTRKGMARALEELTGDSGRYIVSLHTYRKAGDTKYIIAVTTTGAAAANNVKVYAIDGTAFTAARIDTVGRTWLNPTKVHYGVTVDNVFYGGVVGEAMYSWDGTTWDADAQSNTFLAAVDDINTNVSPATEYGRDYAYTGKEKVTYGGSIYTPDKSIRYDRWETGEHYSVGDRVSLKGAWGAAGASYWKSFKCIKQHDADATNKPQLGTGTPGLYWQKVTISLPEDADGEAGADWTLILTAPETSIAQWYASRLWARGDAYGDKSRLMFSAPSKPQKGEDITDTVWDPRDWTPGSDNRGDGGGWLSFNDGKHGGSITNLAVYDNYLVVFKRQATWVLTGQSSLSFSRRKLGNMGCVSPHGSAHHRGLLYFLSEDGLYVTDGTVAEPVQGLEKVRDWMKARLDIVQDDAYAYQPCVFSWGDFVWVALSAPGEATDPYCTVAYHPETGSWYKTTLPVLDVTKMAKDGKQDLYFSTPLTYGLDIVYKATGNQDDTGVATQAYADIPWYMTTAWWPFGLAREERRIRRVWALVKGAATYTIASYRNFDGSTVASTEARVVSGSNPSYIEGETIPDCHSVAFKLSAPDAPSTVHGIAVHTQPRRKRYHT